jgi:glycosyltransferase involved in cell wall biosynthesis
LRKVRGRLRELMPGPLRERYHRYALRRDFGIDRKTESRRPGRIDPDRLPGLNVIGYFESPSGVGQSARSLADAAEKAGIPVARLNVSARDKRLSQRAPYDVNLYHVNADGAAAIVEELGPGLHSGRANVAYWYWESEEFPARWQDRFDYFDEVWVASEFCRSAFASRSPIPVVLVPPAVAPSAPAGDPRSRAGLVPSDFLVLTILDALSVPERKNPLGAVRAFARAFPGSSNALLRVQIRNLDRVPGLRQALLESGRGARISITESTLSRTELESLLAACDAYLSLHRAEGFAFPIAEAMALGKPVVATGYSGNADYFDDTTGFPVAWDYRELTDSIRDYDKGTRWAEPDEEDAARLLRRIFERREEDALRGRAAARRIAQLYGQDPVARRLSSRLEELRRRLSSGARQAG